MDFYTAIYGEHIPLQEFDPGKHTFTCYTDRLDLPESKTWKIVHAMARGENPRMSAKWWKLFPPAPDATWIDASIRVIDPGKLAQACNRALKHHPVAFFAHPERTNIYDEATASLANRNKYADLPLREQVEAYRAAGLPDDHGLWAGGVIARRPSPAADLLMLRWWEEIERWSYQDQLSLPFALWLCGMIPGRIEGNVYGTEFHTWQGIPDPAHAPVVSNDHPFISIITPSHRLTHLGDCWRALQEQSYKHFEWIVSVNSSTGRSAVVDTLARAAQALKVKDPRFRVIEDFSPVASVGARKRFAAEHATGEIIVEYDHDDIMVPTALEEIVKAFKDPEVGFAYSDSIDFVEGDQHLQGFQTYRAPSNRNGWLGSGFTFYEQEIEGIRPGKYECVRWLPPTARYVSHISTAPNHVRAWRRSVYTQIGGHNPNYKVCDDLELILRTYLTTKMHHIQKPLYLQRITGWNTWLQNLNEIQQTSNALREEYLERLVLRECTLLDMPAIELGGGIDPRAGWTAADLEGAPITCDLRERWPWEDNSVGAFRASDLLEHLPDKIHTMRELHRCLRPGGWLLSMTPSADGWGAHMDPTHVSYWNEGAFWYFTREASSRYIRSAPLFEEFNLGTVTINIQGRGVPYVRADLIKR